VCVCVCVHQAAVPSYMGQWVGDVPSSRCGGSFLDLIRTFTSFLFSINIFVVVTRKRSKTIRKVRGAAVLLMDDFSRLHAPHLDTLR
jgi:hypothetical protein